MATIEWRGKNKDIAYLSTQGYRKSLGRISADEANKRLQDFEAHVNRSHTLFDMFAIEYLDWHETEYPDSHFRIRQISEQWLIPFFSGKPIEDLTEFDIEGYKLARNAAPATVAKEIRTLVAIINRAVRWKRITENPLRDVEYPRQIASKPPHFYTKEDLQELYKHSPEHRWIWQFLANTGLRRSEFLNLQDRNIQGDRLIIESAPGARTKSRKHRIIPLSEGAKEAMQHDYRYKGWKQSITRAFAKCARRADIDGSLHSLRHTFCSHLVMAGVPLRTVQVLAGHSTIAVTERYAHLAPDYLTNSVERLDL